MLIPNASIFTEPQNAVLRKNKQNQGKRSSYKKDQVSKEAEAHTQSNDANEKTEK